MSSNLVVVAIPDENDRVWKVSSEKVPHLTLLFLGEDANQVANLDSIMQFVEHAASTSLKRFYLPVDRRDELGEAKADVLYFKKNRYDFKAVRDFRSLLLKDDNIKTAWDATSQFELPEHAGAAGQPWIPHLTLGYPETPAKPMSEEWGGFYSVDFDRIAVWAGDYEGPEFRLKDYWEDLEEMGIDMDVPMSDMAHYGTKGMKWGVRKQELSGGGHIRISNKDNVATISNASTTAIVGVALVVPGIGAFGSFLHPRVRREWGAAVDHNRLVRQDKKWKKQIDKSKKAIEVHNTAADEINSKIGAFNSDKRWKDADGKDLDLTKDPVKQKEYDDSVTREVINPAYSNAAVKVYGSKSPSERYTFEVNNASKGELKLTDALAERRKEQLAGARHAATDEDDPIEAFSVPFKISRDTNGHILGFALDSEDDPVEHTIELGAEFLAHYGVKGMRWGVNRDDISRAAESSSSRLGAAVREADRFSRDVEFEANTRGVINPNTRVEETSKAKADVEEKGYENFRKQDLPVIKKKPEYVKASKLRNRLFHPRDPATKAYRKEVKAAYIKRLEEAANSMSNASGTRQYTIREQGGSLPGSKYSWEVSTREVKHAAIEEHTFTVDVIMDEDGFITGLEKTGDVLTQSMDFGSVLISDLMNGNDEVEHYGVKGMRWGVRREAPSAVAPVATSKVPHGARRKTKVKTEGGENHPASDDAIKVAQAKAKFRKSGTEALSNKELQELQTRLNLERNVKQLMPVAGTLAKGRKFVKDFTGLNKEANEFGRGVINTQNILREARG